MDSLKNIVNSAVPAKARFHIVRSDEEPSKQEYACSKCKDAGFIRANVEWGHPSFGKALACECKIAERKKRLQQQLVDVSGIMSLTLFEEATFQSFDFSKHGTITAFQEATKYAENPDGWLVLVGPYGCGKTHLAVAIAKKRIEAGQTVMILTAPDLLDYLREAFDPKIGESYSERFEQMRNVDLLILDDYGAQQGTPWANEKLFQLLNYRYNKRMSTVLTSNGLEGTEPRLRSRMHDKKIARLVRMDEAQDYRIYGDEE